MRKIKDVLRLHFKLGLSNRAIARSLSVSHTTVSELLGRFQVLGLKWPLPVDLDEAALEANLYPGNTGKSRRRPEPDWHEVHRELRKDKHVTLQLLWLEYKAERPDGYQYSQFCARYRQWRQKLDVVMRQTHRAGEKTFLDFAGDTVPVVDPRTGEVQDAHLFVSVLGASSYAFAEAFEREDTRSWAQGIVDAAEFYGGMTEVLVPDNPKSVIPFPDRYEPGINATLRDLAAHYGTVIIPARTGHPRDKAKVESGVLLVERWILARLRKRTFFSLAELNQAIRELLVDLNNRPFQKLAGCRRSQYEELDQPALKPLPPKRFEFAEWKRVRVNLDYHVEVDKNYYSVPHSLVHKEVEVRLTASIVEILFKGRRVASHRRRSGRGQYVTEVAHMPKAHQQYLNRTPTRLIEEAAAIGSKTAALVQAILAERPHPEQGYRSCLGVLRLGRHYPQARMEAAAERALRAGALAYRHLKSILDHGLDRVPLEPRPDQPPVPHDNVRGANYFNREVTSC